MCLPSTLEKSIALILRCLKQLLLLLVLVYEHIAATFVFLNGLSLLLIHTISMVFYAILAWVIILVVVILFHFRLCKTNFLFRQHNHFLNFKLLCQLLRFKRRTTVSPWLLWWSCLVNTTLLWVLFNLEILNCRLLVNLNGSVVVVVLI